MKKLWIGIVAALLVIACSSCVIVTDEDEDDTGTVELYNDKSLKIERIVLYEVGSDDSIFDSVRDSTVSLRKGDTYYFYDVPNGRYYLGVTDEDNDLWYSDNFNVDGNTRTKYFSDMNTSR